MYGMYWTSTHIGGIAGRVLQLSGRPAPIHPSNPVRSTSTLRSSSVVERSAVNRLVVGSNPTCGATFMSVAPVYQAV